MRRCDNCNHQRAERELHLCPSCWEGQMRPFREELDRREADQLARITEAERGRAKAEDERAKAVELTKKLYAELDEKEAQIGALQAELDDLRERLKSDS